MGPGERERLNEDQVRIIILSAWLAGELEYFNAQALMMRAIVTGVPLKKADVLAIVRAYIDANTENEAWKRP
jgi:hypothetical protein